jgi:hypothetical protein
LQTRRIAIAMPNLSKAEMTVTFPDGTAIGIGSVLVEDYDSLEPIELPYAAPSGTVYALLDPRFTGIQSVRYIGVTHKTVRQRRGRHLSAARAGTSTMRVYQWIRELLEAGLEPEPVALQTEADERHEARWINFFRDLGAPLCNSLRSGQWLFRALTPEDRRELEAHARNGEGSRCLPAMTRVG